MTGGLFWWLPIVAGLTWPRYRANPVPLMIPVVLQLSGASAFVGLFFGGVVLAGAILFPPLWLLIAPGLFGKIQGQVDIQTAFLLGAILAGVLALTSLRLLAGKSNGLLGYTAVITFVCSGWLGGLGAASLVAESKIQNRAEELRASCIRTHSFVISLSIYGKEFPTDMHATAIIDEKLHYWSYRQNDFYPRDTAQNQPTKCPPP